jgi:hypothetical protein
LIDSSIARATFSGSGYGFSLVFNRASAATCGAP